MMKMPGEESDAALEIRGLGAVEIKRIGAEAKENISEQRTNDHF